MFNINVIITMKRFFSGAALMAAMFMMPMMAGAQDKVEASVGADLVSNYVWRGMKLGDAAIQPCMSVSYKGFSLEAWGSYGLTSSDDTKEVDLTLSYTTGGLTVAVTDYFVEGAGSLCSVQSVVVLSPEYALWLKCLRSKGPEH